MVLTHSRAVMLSLKSIKAKSEIESISARIGHARSNLVLSLLVYLQTEVSSNTQQFQVGHQEIVQEARRITKQTLAIQADVAYLSEKLGGLEFDEQPRNEDVKYEYQYVDKEADDDYDDDDDDHGDVSESEKADADEASGHDGRNPSKEMIKSRSEVLEAETKAAADRLRASASPADQNFTVDEESNSAGSIGKTTDSKSQKDTEREDKCEQEKNELRYLSIKKHAKLQEITERLSNVLVRLNQEYTSLSLEFDDLSPLIDREICGRRRVLESLYFPKMNDRRNRVTRAHKQTFQWIFKKSVGDENVIWDDFFDWLCNQVDQPIYWIFGKPGCGKTTMVRELDERMTQQAHLQDWTEGRDLLRLSCYFWYAGTAEQKSLLGFLRNLLYQLFEQRPDLIDKVLPLRWWEEALLPQLQLRVWEENDLVQIIHDVLRATSDSKILMFVDGLDEFDGTDELRDHFLDLLVSLTAYPHVKACVASRYWNIFRDRFKSCPKIRLEDLTVDDINSYVREKIGGDALFHKQQKRWEQQHGGNLLDEISEEIIGKARGVFLWVRLAVRDLLKVLRDGGRAKQLFRELKNIPSDLDDYFATMMETIDQSYRKDASMMLQTALCSMDYSLDGGRTLVSGPDLLLVHLDYLEEHVDPCFAAVSQLQTIDYLQDEEDIDDLLESLDRRLMSRCMGLLEIDTLYQWACNAERHPWTTKIEFLHRTVRDFLLKRSTQKTLRDYSGSDFDAHLFRCNTLIANVSMPGGTNGLELHFGSFACFFRQIQERSKDDQAAAILLKEMTRLLSMQAHQLSTFINQSSLTHVRADSDFIECVRSYLDPKLTTNAIEKLDRNGYAGLSKQIEPKQHRDDCCKDISSACPRKRPRRDSERPLAYLGGLAQPTLDPKLEQMGYEHISDHDENPGHHEEDKYFDVWEFRDEPPSHKKSKSSHELGVAATNGLKVEEVNTVVID